MKILILSFFVLVMLGCSGPMPVVEGTIGLVTPTGSSIDLYNEDGSFWYRFEVVNDLATNAERIRDPNPDFVPYAFRSDYTPLYLRVVGERGLSYEVIANEKTGLRKLVGKWFFVRFQSWEEHLLHTFSVELKDKSNILLDLPSEGGKPIELPAHILMTPIELKGDWLKVKWTDINEAQVDKQATGYGWLKWKEGDKLLINWFYFA